MTDNEKLIREALHAYHDVDDRGQGWHWSEESLASMRAAFEVFQAARGDLWEFAYEADGYWDGDEFVVEEYRHVGDTAAHAVARRRKAGGWESMPAS